MNRRNALKKSGWILQTAVFTPGLVAAIQGCQSKVAEGVTLAVLDRQGFILANAIADTIIPQTDTPSASEVKVVQFMDLLLRDVFPTEVTESFVEGLRQFDDTCVDTKGSSFVEMDGKDRANYLETVDQEVMSQSYPDRAPFYYTFKRLCVTTYFSSEQGVKKNLEYQPVPGSYQADIELKPGDKIRVGNQM